MHDLFCRLTRQNWFFPTDLCALRREFKLSASRKSTAGTSPRRAAESVARVSILELRNAGLLQNSSNGVVVCNARSVEEEVLSVTYEGGVVKIGRWISVDDRFPEFHNELVEIQTVPKQFGGEQPYFVCNGCGTRRVYLYNLEGRLRCRVCIGLVHKSSQERVRGRSLRQARKIRRRLRCSEALVDPALPPKGMHQRTFHLQLAKLHRAEMRYFISIASRRWRNSCPSV
jgi:hypothetical protein